jgi:rod shape-determining protein MreC
MGDRLATIVFVSFAVLLLVLMAAQAQRMETVSAMGQSFRGTTGQAWQGLLGVAGGVQRIWENYLYVVGARHDREALLEKINHLEVERQRANEISQENIRLRRMLDLKDESAFPEGVMARVVADLSSGPLRRAVLVDRGSSSGIGPGWVVIARGALVGRVRTVESGSAEVLLISDPDSGVAVRHQLDRFAGILRGGNRGPAILSRLEYVPRDQAVAVGDAIVTSGLDGVFPPGLLAGYVRDMYGDSPLTWRISVELAVDLSNLEEVLLVPAQHRPPTPRTAPVAPRPVPPPPPDPAAATTRGAR